MKKLLYPIIIILLLATSCANFNGSKFEGTWKDNVGIKWTIKHISGDDYLAVKSTGFSTNLTFKKGKLEGMGGMISFIYDNGKIIVDGDVFEKQMETDKGLTDSK